MDNKNIDKIDNDNLTASGGHIFETKIKDAEKYGLKRKKKIFKKDVYYDNWGNTFSKKEAEHEIKCCKNALMIAHEASLDTGNPDIEDITKFFLGVE